MGFLHVLLMILKILGIVLASVLGLILLILLMVLLVPFRYRIEGHKKDDIFVLARLTWLFHLLNISFTYTGSKSPLAQVRIFGKIFYDSTEFPEKEIKKEVREGSKEAEKKAAEQIPDSKKKKKTGKQISESKQGNAKNVKSTPEEKSENGINDKPKELDMTLPKSETEEYESYTEQETKTFFTRIRDKLLSVIFAPVRLVRTIRYKYRVLYDFIQLEENKTGIRLLLKSISGLLKHMRPRNTKGYLNYGTGDPSSTGYILAVLGIFYGKYGKSIRICPNFEEPEFECELIMKGRIISIVLIVLFIKLWFNKNFKSLRTNFGKFQTDFGKSAAVS